VPQKIGWRYQPHAHGKRPCGCPACLPRGSIKSRAIREKYDPEPRPVSYETLARTLRESSNTDTLIESLWSLRYKLRKTDPAFLERLMGINDAELQEHLALTLGHFKHENSKRMLLALCQHELSDVKEAAAESLFQLYRQDAGALLFAFRLDPAIGKVIENNGSFTR
jgi:hypothetical protein